MKKLNIKMKNCYGIRNLEHSFDFEFNNNKKNNQIHVIYSQNGSMKSSFAKTFENSNQVQKLTSKTDKEEIKIWDRIRDKEGVFEAKLDNNPIETEKIFVFRYGNNAINNTEEYISKILADKDTRENYTKLQLELNKIDKEIFNKLKSYTGLKVEEDFWLHLVKHFSNKEVSVEEKKILLLNICAILKNSNYSTYKDINYNIVYTALNKMKTNELEHLQKNIKEYMNRRKDLINKSYFFMDNFDDYHADQLYNSIVKQNFFTDVQEKEKQIITRIRDEQGNMIPPITNAQELKNAIDLEKSKITNDKQLQEELNKIAKILHANSEYRAFYDIIQNHPIILDELLNPAVLYQNLWYSYFETIKTDLDGYIKEYDKYLLGIADLIENIDKQKERWNNVIDLFNDRFINLPFIIDIKNLNQATVGEKPPEIVFYYKVYNSEDDTKPEEKSVEKSELKNYILSNGERTAMDILDMIYIIEQRKKDGEETILIFDDVADSFDYKNKYAIVEYLMDIFTEEIFYGIILTHNFDFYRIINSRLAVKEDNQWISHRNKMGDISLEKSGLQIEKSPITLWKELSNEPFKAACRFIALIPFVRNLIEYKGGEKDKNFTDLTNVLHIKADKETTTSVLEILQKNLTLKNIEQIPQNKDMYDYIISTADNILKETDECLDTILEKKIVLSIAIRLFFEEWFLNPNNKKLNTYRGNIDELQKKIKKGEVKNQFNEIRNIIKNNLSTSLREEIAPIYNKISIIVSENIHLNSFMYEPLIDTGLKELSKLYEEVTNIKV